ncbi:hypothetical protein Sfulv_37520 [Streptomyces fulvorobeus]|uniref:Uncharacterized protein n=1 Tax=Streptomyces fulvorobeus TaxID=284028 RepID=A0A7J0C8Z6_9ACTN|nr:hypothetical protein Sfulv_37520 [Streptomyces fulvorobeus]
MGSMFSESPVAATAVTPVEPMTTAPATSQIVRVVFLARRARVPLGLMLIPRRPGFR